MFSENKSKWMGRFLSTFVIGAMLSSCDDHARTMQENEADLDPVVEEVIAAPIVDNLIKIALLLDTSGSMNGLIEQAKSQLWKIVNELTMAKKGGENAELQIALYEYGNDGLNQENGYIRQIVPLTTDLDEISKELFALTTNGGSEFCGEVIAKSLSELDWKEESEALQVIFIAGNEEFTQGGLNYVEACGTANESDVIVNTIFCGDLEQGIQMKWKDGADLTEGFYGTIEMNEAAVFIESPYDDQIEALNVKLNKTYLGYGAQKDYYANNQMEQDYNSHSYGSGNAVERTITKSSHVYKNESWDLVDAKKEANFKLEDIQEEELPDEMKGMSLTEKEAYIAKNDVEREEVKDQIKILGAQREIYIEEQKEILGIESNGLDKAMTKAIRKQAIEKGFVFEDSSEIAVLNE